MKRYSGRVRGFGTPIQISDRPVLGMRYGIHAAYAEPGAYACLKVNTGWRTLSGFSINTPWGSVWVYLRNWRHET